MALGSHLQGRQTQFHVDLLYGALFVGGFAYLVFRVDPRVAAFEGGLVVGYLLRIWEKMSIYERLLEVAVSAEAEQQVSEEVEQQVADEVAAETERQVAVEAERQVSEEVADEVAEAVERQVADEVDQRVEETVDRELADQLPDGAGSEE